MFGIDLNNNGWIDRFEDDDLPDYPYKTDRRGYNALVNRNYAGSSSDFGTDRDGIDRSSKLGEIRSLHV